jgi:PilZ domain
MEGKREFVSQSSTQAESTAPSAGMVILLERNDELSEFARLLEEFGLPFSRCTTDLPDGGQLANASLVVASAQRLVESGPPHLSLWPLTIAVVRDASKTLSSHLHRIGVSMILCQPVHPQALRLLLLHSIYRGPERRNRKRTPIGHPIRVGTGLFRSKATLLEISPRGARIEMSHMPKIGSVLRIQLGKQLTLGRPLKLNAKVVRRIEKPHSRARAKPEVGLSILEAHENRHAIRAILDRFADGPATLKSAAPSTHRASPGRHEPTKPPTSTGVPEDSTGERDLDTSVEASSFPPEFRAETIPESKGEVREEPHLATNIDREASSERRAEERIPYHRRIVALDREAARVLVGHDLSRGGMRVTSNPPVVVDDVLRVALHCGTQMEPLVLTARALRDDGEDGVVLGFVDLLPDQRDHLEKIISSSGPIRAPRPADSLEAESTDSLVVGELLETLEPSEMKESALDIENP